MRSLALPAYTTPPFYNLLTLPLPSLTRPTDVLIRVVAAGLNPGDMHVAAGAFKFAAKRAYLSLFPSLLATSLFLDKKY